MQQGDATEYDRSPTVLIADDHQDIIGSLERRLRKRGFTVMKSVSALARLPREVRLQRPDIVLLDVFFGKDNALDRLPQLRRANPRTRYVVYTGADDPSLATLAFVRGASAFVLKLYHEELFVGIESALAGGTFLASCLRGSVAAAGDAPQLHALTTEQERLLALLRSGTAQQRIATELLMSRRTLERRVASLARALHIDRQSNYHINWRRVGAQSD